MFSWLLIIFMFVFISLLCTHIFLYCLYWKARRNFKHLPSYSQLPFLGSMHWFFGNGQALFRRLSELSRIMDEKNLPFVVWIGPRPLILLCHPEDVKTVAYACIDKPYLYKFGKTWLGEGLVTASGHIWKRNIKTVAGNFTKSEIDGFQEAFNMRAKELTNNLKKKAKNGPFDAMPYLCYVTLSTICQTGFGVTYCSGSKEIREYYEALASTLELIIKRGLNLLYHLDIFYRLSNDYEESLKSINVMHNVSNMVIQRKIRERDNKKPIENYHKDLDGDIIRPRFKTVLDALLDVSETDPHMTREQVRSEVHTLIVGGQKTVSTTLCHVFLMLGRHPDVQEKLYQEIKEVLNNKSDIDKNDLTRLMYCEAVVLETLRLFPPLPAVIRQVNKDLKIHSCTIPKGTICALNLFGAGRSKRVWGPDADHFDPERWFQRNSSLEAFMAFSAGRRSCIGKRYAMAIMKTIVAHCVKNLEFISESKQMEFTVDIELRAVVGNLLKVKIRD